MNHHPIQPLVTDELDTLRFKENTIISYLFKSGKLDMSQLAAMTFPSEDRQQIAQLLGYSLSGYSELSYVTDDAYEAASAMVESETADSQKCRIEALEAALSDNRDKLRDSACAAFHIHPGDLAA